MTLEKEINIQEAVPVSEKRENSGVYYFIVPDGTIYASKLPLEKLKKLEKQGLGIVPAVAAALIGGVASVGGGAFSFFKSKNERKAAEQYAQAQAIQATQKAQQQQTLLLVGGGLAAALILVLALKK